MGCQTAYGAAKEQLKTPSFSEVEVPLTDGENKVRRAFLGQTKELSLVYTFVS